MKKKIFKLLYEKLENNYKEIYNNNHNNLNKNILNEEINYKNYILQKLAEQILNLVNEIQNNNK